MRRLTPAAPAIAALAAVAGVAACGEDSGSEQSEAGSATSDITTGTETAPGATERFLHEDFSITFEYPAGLDVRDNVSFGATSGSGPEESAGVRLGPEDFFAIQRFGLNVAITDENLDQFIPEADAVFSELADEEVSGERTEVGGFPALEYEFGPSEPRGGATRAVVILDGDTEYLLTCKATETHSEEIGAACDTAVETLEPR